MDEIDRAKEHERLHRRLSQEAQDKRREEELTQKALIIDGVICCLDCEEPIPEERLKKRPESVRCVPCKTIYEKENPHVPPFANQNGVSYGR